MRWIELVVVTHLVAVVCLMCCGTVDGRPGGSGAGRKQRHRGNGHKGSKGNGKKQFRALLRRVFSRRLATDGSVATREDNRPIMIPTVDCKLAEDKLPTFACPTPHTLSGAYVCIDDNKVCDGTKDCPGGEDENATSCMFHKMTMNYFRVLWREVTSLKKQLQSKSKLRSNKSVPRTKS